jgi:hypothetical protein
MGLARVQGEFCASSIHLQGFEEKKKSLEYHSPLITDNEILMYRFTYKVRQQLLAGLEQLIIELEQARGPNH